MARTKNEESIPSSDFRPESSSGRERATGSHDQDLEAKLEYVPTPDAAQRLAQAYELLFRKMGKIQMGAVEEPGEGDEQKGKQLTLFITCGQGVSGVDPKG